MGWEAELEQRRHVRRNCDNSGEKKKMLMLVAGSAV